MECCGISGIRADVGTGVSLGGKGIPLILVFVTPVVAFLSELRSFESKYPLVNVDINPTTIRMTRMYFVLDFDLSWTSSTFSS